MIYDKMDNLVFYRGVTDALDTAMNWLESGIYDGMDEGVIDIDGKRIYAVCSEYMTKPRNESRFEAHRKYIDIQIVLYGSEIIGISDLANLSVTDNYSEEKDALFAEGREDCSIRLQPGYFCILFPDDAHMPGLNSQNDAVCVRKLVVKVNV